jgi:hypothetical protein
MSASIEIVAGEKKMTTLEQEAPATEAVVVPAISESAQPAPQLENPGSGRTVGIIIAVVLIIVIAYGLYLRSASEKKLVSVTEDAAILSVRVVHPVAGSQAGDLAVPGNVEAFTETPITHAPTAICRSGTSTSALTYTRATFWPWSKRPKSTSS